MNKNLIFITLLGLIFSIACNDSKQLENNNDYSSNATYNISEDQIGGIKYTEYILDKQAKSTAEQWQKYTELEGIIADVKKADFSFFIENNDVLLAFLKDIKESVPERFDTPAILARIIALETVFLKFEDQLMRANASEEKLIEVVKEVLTSFSNLNLQINKKFEKEAQNIQKP